jgi:hypothetical protein
MAVLRDVRVHESIVGAATLIAGTASAITMRPRSTAS